MSDILETSENWIQVLLGRELSIKISNHPHTFYISPSRDWPVLLGRTEANPILSQNGPGFQRKNVQLSSSGIRLLFFWVVCGILPNVNWGKDGNTIYPHFLCRFVWVHPFLRIRHIVDKVFGVKLNLKEIDIAWWAMQSPTKIERRGRAG